MTQGRSARFGGRILYVASLGESKCCDITYAISAAAVIK
jgi:hypothetical protein